ncbi:MAG: ABC transporter permease [Lachnospiraceae bacterium]|nr:ABC transporter permease [Lachnospiraceae bacterium]
MKRRMLYLCMELNKTLRLLPRMLMQAVLLMVLMGLIAFGGVRSMDREPLAVSVDIAVAVQDDDALTQMALGFVESMESVSEFCRFRQVSEEEGLALLAQEEVTALIVLPERLVDGIVNGQNPSVEIYFAEHAGIEAVLFKELTDAGASLLNVAQAEIYGANDTAAEYGFTDRLRMMEMEIDGYNLAFALDRLALYETRQLSVTGQMNVIQYFAASAAVLFLLLSGMALYPLMQPEAAVFRRQLARQGVGFGWQDFCQWLCGFVSMGLIAALLPAAARFLPAAARFLSAIAKILPAGMETVGEEPEVWTQAAELLQRRQNAGHMGMSVFLIVCSLMLISTCVYCIYSLTGSRISGILLLFVVSLMMIYLSGGLAPSIFLPETMQKLGGRLPTAWLIRAFGGVFTGYEGEAAAECAAGICGYTILLGGCAWLCRRRYDRLRV